MKKALVMTCVLLTSTACGLAELLQSDDFNDGVWSSQWEKYTDDWNKVSESDGAVWFAKYYGDPWAERGMYSGSSYDVHTEADFTIAIDYDLTWDCPWHDDWRLTWDDMHLELYTHGKMISIQRAVRNGGDAEFYFSYDGTNYGIASIGLSAEVMEGMKLERVGDILLAYYKVASGDWTLLGSVDVSADLVGFDDTAYLRSRIVVNEDRDGKMRVNDFAITQTPEPMTAILLTGGALALLRRKP